ncbi:hypothetical protein Lal_00041529 [Lupinus albus]|nr:hypothetical protein Lal_00041529 [Lupinus albus]
MGTDMHYPCPPGPVAIPKHYILKYAGKALRQFRTDVGKCLRDVDDNVKLKPPIKYANLIDEAYWKTFITTRTQDTTFVLEQSDTPLSVVDLDVLWVDAHKNKEGVIDNEQVQEVTLKERIGLLHNPYSQVVLEKALGLPQYSSRIRGAGFGVDKRTLKLREKRATKFVVADLESRLDDLTQRFIELEHSMKSKEPEGHQQAVDVPSLGISSCKLFLDILSPGVGTVHNTPNVMLHNARIPPNHVKVAIDIAIEDDALLPIPFDEDIITLGWAIGNYVTWLVHLVDVGKGIAEHSATSPPRVEHANKKAKVMKSKLKENKSRSKSSYNRKRTETLLYARNERYYFMYLALGMKISYALCSYSTILDLSLGGL